MSEDNRTADAAGHLAQLTAPMMLAGLHPGLAVGPLDGSAILDVLARFAALAGTDEKQKEQLSTLMSLLSPEPATSADNSTLHAEGEDAAPQHHANVANRTTDSAPSGPEPEAGKRSDDVREQLAAWEDRLHREARLTDKVLDQLDPWTAPQHSHVPQQELTIQCSEHGSSAARFVLYNSTESAVDLSFDALRGTGVAVDWWHKLHVEFTPTAPHLAAGESCTVRIAVDLRDCPALLADDPCFVVNANGQDLSLLKIWVNLQLIGDPDD